MFFVVTIAAVALIFFFFIYWKLIRAEKQVYDRLRAQGVPGEPFVPIIGQMPALRRARENGTLMEYHQQLAKKHGPVFLIGYGPLVRLVILQGDLLSDVFSRANASNYGKPIDFRTVLRPMIGVHNLLVSEGVEHERARQMLNPAFHLSNLRSMISIMTQQTAETIDRLLVNFHEQSIDLQKELNTLTLSIIACSAFGQGLETVANAREIICQTFPEVLDAVMYRTTRLVNLIPFLSRLPFGRKDLVEQGMKKITEFLERIIRERREGQSSSACAGDDLLDLLLSALDEDGQPLTDEEIKEQALTFVLAGHETTGNLMVWLMYLLMTHSQAFLACRDEVDRVLPDGREPTPEHLNELPICEAVLSETLRLYPPAPLFTRYCTQEHTIGSVGGRQLQIPVHTTVWLNIYNLHRQENYWSRPNEFDYTRWLRDPITGLKPKLTHPFCYLPFAAGSRNCIGQDFVLLEAKVILAMFVQQCDLRLEPGQTITPDIRITMRPKYGLWPRVTRRL